MKSATIGQSFNALGILGTNTDWKSVPFDMLEHITRDPKRFGKSFTAFLKNGGRFTIIGEHIIDCDAAPYIPDGWFVEKHKKGGQQQWDPANLELYLSNAQQVGGRVDGHELRKELTRKLIMNANVLDYLLANPTLIPEEWKEKEYDQTPCIFFWGTIYKDAGDTLLVRWLNWNDVELHWSWSYDLLNFNMRKDSFAACFAS